MQSSKDGILHRGGYVWKLAAYSISRLNCEQVMYREQCNVRYPEEGGLEDFLCLDEIYLTPTPLPPHWQLVGNKFSIVPPLH